MAMVSVVAVVFIFVFFVILLFHFAQQNRYNTAMQMESIARSVRLPLSAAVLKADIPQAEAILQQIKPAGIISRADVVLPNQFQALRVKFYPGKAYPGDDCAYLRNPGTNLVAALFAGTSREPAAFGLSGAAGRLLANVQIYHQRHFYPGDIVAAAFADAVGGHYLVH